MLPAECKQIVNKEKYMCYTIPYGRQRILFDDEQKFFVDGEAGFEKK